MSSIVKMMKRKDDFDETVCFPFKLDENDKAVQLQQQANSISKDDLDIGTEKNNLRPFQPEFDARIKWNRCWTTSRAVIFFQQ